MLAPTFTALAVIFTLGQQANIGLQIALQAAVPITEDVVTPPASTTPIPTGISEEAVLDPQPVITPIEADPAPITSAPEPVIVEPVVREALPSLSDADKALILSSASDAMAAARTVEGRFTQTNSDQTVSGGTFAMRRPGRMRFDYDDPTPILIVSDGTTVAFEDSELVTVDRVPLGATPLGPILNDGLDIADDVNVLRVTRTPNGTAISVEDATGELQGELTLFFAADTYDLLGWSTIDADLQITYVELSEVVTNGRIDPRLFRLDDAADEEDER